MKQQSDWTRPRDRRFSRRRLVGLAAVGGATLALAGCSGRNAGTAQRPSTGVAGTPRAGGKLNVRVPNDPFDWDMSYTGKTIPNDFGISMAYESLLSFKHGAGVKYGDSLLQPQLAEKWETPDPQTYTFHLRQGVKFANMPPVNGRELTAADVKWSYEYWSRTGQFKGKNLPPAQYASYFAGISSIDAPDNYTVVAHFDKPFVPFVNYTGSYFNPIVPHEIYDQDGNLRNRIAGTGPWQLDSSASEKGTRWVWKKNPAYWDTGKPYLDEVDWLIIPDDASATAALQSKQVDIVGALGENFSYNTMQQVIKVAPSVISFEYLPVGATLFLQTNTRKEPLRDARVRQAMSAGLDRDEFVKTFAGGKGGWVLVGSFPDTFSPEEMKQILKYDPAQAKQLLSAAGYANGVDIEFTYPGTDYGQGFVTQIQLVQAQLKKLGINITLKSQDKAAWTDSKKNYTYPMTAQPKADLIGDVDSWLYDFRSGNKANYVGANDPQLDALIDGERRETDPTKRQDTIRQAVKLLNQQAYAVGVFIGSQDIFWQPYVKGYNPNFEDIMVPQADTWVSK